MSNSLHSYNLQYCPACAAMYVGKSYCLLITPPNGTIELPMRCGALLLDPPAAHDQTSAITIRGFNYARIEDNSHNLAMAIPSTSSRQNISISSPSLNLLGDSVLDRVQSYIAGPSHPVEEVWAPDGERSLALWLRTAGSENSANRVAPSELTGIEQHQTTAESTYIADSRDDHEINLWISAEMDVEDPTEIAIDGRFHFESASFHAPRLCPVPLPEIMPVDAAETSSGPHSECVEDLLSGLDLNDGSDHDATSSSAL